MPFKGTAVTDPVNSISRLGTIFHEARHSDGNGKSIGFFHAICPDDSPYAGYGACDGSLNGSYTVGAMSEQMLTESCTDCSPGMKESLRLEYLDSFSRVLKFIPAPDDEATSVLKSLGDLCDSIRRIDPAAVPPMCNDVENQIKALDQPKKPGLPLPWLNPAPEGHFEP